MDDNVTVLPKLAGRFAKQGKPKLVNDDNVDPDVRRVLNASNSNDLDVIGLQHEPTKEELQSEKNSKDNKDSKDIKNNKSSIWNWVIIVLAFIVVILVVAIAWYILKKNTENLKPQPIPPHIIDPRHPSYKGYQMPTQMPTQRHNQMPNHMPNQMPNQTMNRPQTEQLPIQTKSMSTSQPTKLELEETLKKLESIKETTDEPDESNIKKNILKPRNVKTVETAKVKANDTTTTDDSSKNVELDNKLSKKFYDNLQKNLDLDKADSDNEECRDEQD